MRALIFIFGLFITGHLAKHECIHHKLDIPLSIMEVPSKEGFNAGERVLQSKQSIRIYADYTNLRSGSLAAREYIENELMPASIAYFQNVLKINRFTVPISAEFTCRNYRPGPAVRSGVNADLIILVTAETSSESYLAYAQPCSISDYDNRPTYGLINFNLRLLPISTSLQKQENFLTTIHEIVHILGFSSTLYQYYVNPTLANPKNPKTVLFTKTWNGETIRYLNVEPLTSRLQSHFGCNTLEGGYLENEGGSGSAGSHWERQIFFNEFMTASSITDSVISEFTLALLEGTGWYEVDYTYAEPFRWGYQKGCPFVNEKCLDNLKNPIAQPEFCPRLEQQGCSFTGKAVAICGTSNANNFDITLDPDYDYWGNNTYVYDSFSNNCPYMVGYPNGDCEGPEFQSAAFLKQEVYAVGSRCLEGTLSSYGSPGPYTGFCFPVKCVSTGPSSYQLLVTIGNQNIQCNSQGPVSVTGLSGQLMCPDPSDYCNRANPARCVRGCSGKGTCVNNQCQCINGWTGVDCSTRAYVAGCSRCANEDKRTYCYGDTCACIPGNTECPTNSASGVFQISFIGIASLITSVILMFF